MSHFTIITEQEIELILAKFAIKNITSFKLLRQGSENTNYLVIANNSKYVLTICEQKLENKIRELANLLEHLKKHHFQTSKIIRTTENNAIELWNDKPIMLKDFLEGKIIKDLPDHLLERIGKELGILHKIEAPEYLPKQASVGKEQFSIVEKYAANSPFDIWLKEILEYLGPYLSLDLPKTLIHGDVFYDNVIVSEDESSAMIIDFEESSFYYRVFDIGMTIIGICGEGKIINLNKVGSLLKGYQQEVQLLDIELKALQAFTVYAGAAMAFWRHKNFNYTNPDPNLTDHYMGLKVLADYVKRLPVDCFFPK